ncbi:STAS domain-containing protein [Streptomyces sp. BH055]|uniref:STAS domain-containing protein n=1 Tax=unclassified Streptomyces TaxID=2593676 RepID=UPI003BB76FB3
MHPHPDLSVPPEPFAECRVVRPRGELDLTTSTAFGDSLVRARAGTGRLFLIVDMSGLTFMDTSGLDPLCSAWEGCRARHGWMRLVRAPTSARLVLRATETLSYLAWYASVRDAWQGIPSQPGPNGGGPE